MQYPETSWFTGGYLQNLHRLLEALGGSAEIDALQAACPNDATLLEDLQIEYTRLFINGFPHVAAPPYGSVYLDKTLRGKYSDEVLTFYRSRGYNLREDADLPDNIIYQLEFLSFLAEDRNKEGEREFLRRFFLPWFSIFADRVKGEAHHPFYRIIVTLIDFFTKEEEEHGVQFDEA
jgi:TorA maturation chaperone TorD